MSLAAIPCCFAVLAGTLKSVYLSVMLVDFYHHLELAWSGVELGPSSSVLRQYRVKLASRESWFCVQSTGTSVLAWWHQCIGLYYQCLELYGTNVPILHIWRQR